MSAKDFYSQFEDEDTYNAWYKKDSFIRAYIDDPEKAKSSFDYEDDWLEDAERERILRTEDFKDYSGYISTKADDLWEKMWSQ